MTALCTHGVQTGAGYSCSACVTSPVSSAQNSVPLSMLLDAYSAWISRGVQVLLDPGRGPVSDILETSANADKVRAEIIRRFEERTGVSDVQHAVAGSVAEIRRGLDLLSPLSPGLVAHLRIEVDRIEQWTRGEQR